MKEPRLFDSVDTRAADFNASIREKQTGMMFPDVCVPLGSMAIIMGADYYPAPAEEVRPVDFMWCHYARLDEALYRLYNEPKGHSFRKVAMEEMLDIEQAAVNDGFGSEGFNALVEWVKVLPRSADDGETWIETPEGQDRYFGKSTRVYGEGSFPADDPKSIQAFLAIIGAPQSLIDKYRQECDTQN